MGHHFLGVSGSGSCEKRCLEHPLKTCPKERYQYSHPRKDRKVTDQHVSGILPFDLFFGLLYSGIESPTWNSWKWCVWFLNMPTGGNWFSLVFSLAKFPTNTNDQQSMTQWCDLYSILISHGFTINGYEWPTISLLNMFRSIGDILRLNSYKH